VDKGPRASVLVTAPPVSFPTPFPAVIRDTAQEQRGTAVTFNRYHLRLNSIKSILMHFDSKYFDLPGGYAGRAHRRD